MKNERNFAWARLNSDGILLVGLLLISAVSLTDQHQTNVAEIANRVPTLQPVWLTGYCIAGLLMLYGFIKANWFIEAIGRAIMCVGLLIQTFVFVSLVGAGIDGYKSIAILLLVLFVTYLRLSALLGSHGLTITIPPANRSKEENVEAQHDRQDGEPRTSRNRESNADHDVHTSEDKP